MRARKMPIRALSVSDHSRGVIPSAGNSPGSSSGRLRTRRIQALMPSR